MIRIRKLTFGKDAKGLFLCEECNTEVVAGYYKGVAAKSCLPCKYKVRKKKENLCSSSKHEYLRVNGYNTSLYSVWKAMKARCHNPKASGYNKYGAKGVTVCKEWYNSYVAYAEWMLDNGYDPSLLEGEYKHRHSIDRVDDTKGYSPSNCQILTVSENSIKRNDNKRIEVHVYDVLDGSYITTFSSLMEAAKNLKVDVKHIPEIMSDESNRNQTKGYMFSADKTDKMEIPKNTRIQLPFEAFNKEGISVGIYKTKKEFAEKYDVAITNISKVLNGKRKHTKGFTFKYL